MSKESRKPNILVTLEFDKRVYKASDKQELIFTLTNEADQPIRILKWHTPLDGFKSDMFHVEYEGKRVVYLGPVYKRVAPTQDDYVTLAPGEIVTHKVDFTEAYDIADAAVYSVQYKSEFVQAGFEEPKSLAKRYMTPKQTRGVAVTSNIGIFSLEENREPRQVEGTNVEWMEVQAVARKAPSFNACSSARQTTIKSAMTEATKIAAEAKTALSAAPGWARFTAPRYAEWFGKYDETRYCDVQTDYEKIWDALANKTVTFDCSSNDSAYAYVYPTKPYTIYLCKAFWTAPLTGTDSQAGTIVHEMSHFNVVASTADHIYGQAGCRSLAKSNPAKAVDNADSHEYFAENTPPMTMNAVIGTAFKITDGWKNMPPGFTGGYDAAVNGAGPAAGKCYFFKGDQYIRYDWVKDRADAGYPLKIANYWHNLPAGFKGGFNAAVNGLGPFGGKCYFFKGDSCIRYDWNADRVDPGYPLKIADGWRNLPIGFRDNFDAAMNGAGPAAGKCYLFKGDQYVRFDWIKDCADPGYPKKIADYWHCLPPTFTGKFDAAVEGAKQFGMKGYLFKGDFYVRYNWEGDYTES